MTTPPANIADPGARLGAVLRLVSPRLARWATHFEPARARAQIAGLVTALAAVGIVVPVQASRAVEVGIVAAGYVLPAVTGELVRLGVFAPASVAAAVDRSAPAPEGKTGLVVAGPAADEGFAPPRVEAALEQLPDPVPAPPDAVTAPDPVSSASLLADEIDSLPRRSIGGRRWIAAAPVEQLLAPHLPDD